MRNAASQSGTSRRTERASSRWEIPSLACPKTPSRSPSQLDAEGAHLASTHSPSGALSPRRIATRVVSAERFGFTAATFDDSPLPALDDTARLDAVQRAAFAAPLTTAIGLVPVAHVAYSEPFHVATQLTSLDWASRGRAGWIAAASGTAREAAAFGRESCSPDDDLRRELGDVYRGRPPTVGFVGGRRGDPGCRDRPLPRRRQAPLRGFRRRELLGERSADHAPTPAGAARRGRPRGHRKASTSRSSTTRRSLRSRPPPRRRAAAGASRVWADVEVVLDARGVPASQRLASLGAWPQTRRLRHVGNAAGLARCSPSCRSRSTGCDCTSPNSTSTSRRPAGRWCPRSESESGSAPRARAETLADALGLERPLSRYATTAVRELA